LVLRRHLLLLLAAGASGWLHARWRTAELLLLLPIHGSWAAHHPVAHHAARAGRRRQQAHEGADLLERHAGHHALHRVQLLQLRRPEMRQRVVRRRAVAIGMLLDLHLLRIARGQVSLAQAAQ
jgi:hypothetical protein